MSGSDFVPFVAGGLTAGFAVCGLFFLRFWRRTRDTLFLAFSIAFGLLALNQAAPVALAIPREDAAGIYLLRLAAFLLIILAVLGKNLRTGRR